jgi:flagellar biosynthesis anti-sigma factor FlgM
MVDEIRGVGSSSPQRTSNASAPAEEATSEKRADRPENAAAPSPSVEVELSEGVQRSEQQAQFDEAKVRELKDQIEKSNYPLDAEKIAEKFADLEQLL